MILTDFFFTKENICCNLDYEEWKFLENTIVVYSSEKKTLGFPKISQTSRRYPALPGKQKLMPARYPPAHSHGATLGVCGNKQKKIEYYGFIRTLKEFVFFLATQLFFTNFLTPFGFPYPPLEPRSQLGHDGPTADLPTSQV